MITNERFRLITVLAAMLASYTAVARAEDIGTAFSYQGFIENPVGTPVNDTCAFEFKLCDDAAAACAPGTISNHAGIAVTDGVFSVVDVDFGAGAFTGEARWLEVYVQCTGDGGFTLLAPRVGLTPVPHALRATEGVGPPGVLNVTPNGNVGIGTENPTELLDVAGNIHASGTIGAGETIILNGFPPSVCGKNPHTLNLQTGPACTTRMYLDVVTGDPTIVSGQTLRGQNAGAARILGSNGSVSSPPIGFTGGAGVDDGGGGNGIYRPAANTMGFVTASTERMRITSGGQVGIGPGTNPPTHGRLLEIGGTTWFEDVGTIKNVSTNCIRGELAGAARILGSNGSVSSPPIGFTGGAGVDDGGGGNGIYRPAANTMGFVTASTERMRITSGGQVGIGPGTNPPTHGRLLEIGGTTWFEDVGTIKDAPTNCIRAEHPGGARIRGSQGTAASPDIGFLGGAGIDDGGGGNGIYRPAANTMGFVTASTERMRITSGGNIVIAALPPGSYNAVHRNPATGILYDGTASSRRHKENITPLTEDFERLLRAQPVTYTRPGNPDRWEIGWIAEDFHDLGLGRLVTYDQEQRPAGISYEKTGVYLTEIAKTQAQRIEKLEAENAEITSRQADLEARLAQLEAVVGQLLTERKGGGR